MQRISSLFMSELIPACFSCSNIFNLSQSSSGSGEKNIVFEIPEAETNIPGDLSILIRVRSRVDLLPGALTSNYSYSANLYIMFLSAKIARSTLSFLLVIIFKRSPFKSNTLPVSRNVNKMICKVIVIVLCNNKSFTLFKIESFTNLNCLVFSGLVILDRGNSK